MPQHMTIKKMKTYSIPKKYAPYTPTPFAEVKVPPEVFVGFLYSCYFNIELQGGISPPVALRRAPDADLRHQEMLPR